MGRHVVSLRKANPTTLVDIPLRLRSFLAASEKLISPPVESSFLHPRALFYPMVLYKKRADLKNCLAFIEGTFTGTLPGE